MKTFHIPLAIIKRPDLDDGHRGRWRAFHQYGHLNRLNDIRETKGERVPPHDQPQVDEGHSQSLYSASPFAESRTGRGSPRSSQLIEHLTEIAGDRAITALLGRARVTGPPSRPRPGA
jgi:hypothetical protein